ncbi:MAG TPA: trypsin-like serine protease [Vicinamibacterales bacterium]|nr:trypsin-like serine protease [Vicinamibacterales bacterium]
MRRTFTTVLFVAALLATGVPVSTITNGQPDGNRHPFVGVAIQPIPDMPGYFSICSGSALSATVFLTAAHCFDAAQPAFVSYKSGPPFNFATDFTPGTFHPDPDWCPACGPGLPGFDSHDVAVITLSAPRDPGVFAELPAPGLVDTLPMRTSVDIVGYGVQGFIRGGGQPGQVFLLTRYFAPSQLVQSNHVNSGEFIKLTANPAQGKGGICFGDSGGPNVLSGTTTVLAVNSYVTNTNCAGVTYSNRVDLPDILDFITEFLS